ncbi:MAG: hypothetical protein ACFCVH_00475 [Alphaproteobacteria bacterium]
MNRVLLGTAMALLVASPAMAADLGCWNTQSVSANPGSPDGSYLNGASSVDYMVPQNEGVDLLLADLTEFETGTFVICLHGNSTQVDGNTVWQVWAAIICPSSDFVTHTCPG